MGTLRLRSRRRAVGAAGGIGGVVKAIGKVVGGVSKSPLLRALPGIGTVATVAGAGASILSLAGSRTNGVSPFVSPVRSIQSFIPGGATGMEAPAGYHWSKTAGKVVKNRRMNPANGKANARAIRRLDMAEKQFRKIFAFRHGKAPTQVKPRARKKR